MFGYHVRQKNKERRDLAKFNGLIAAPADIRSLFVMPANGELWISSGSKVAPTDITLEVGSRVITTEALAANSRFKLGWFERGRQLDFTLTNEAFTLFLNSSGRYYVIGEAGAIT